MKYIRTKDGIYYVGDLVKDEYGNYCHNVDDKTCEVPANGIIKEAETIEELEALVDEFVLGKTTYHNPCVAKLPLDFLKECIITEVYPGITLYGSIWVGDNLEKVMRFDRDKGWVLL